MSDDADYDLLFHRFWRAFRSLRISHDARFDRLFFLAPGNPGYDPGGQAGHFQLDQGRAEGPHLRGIPPSERPHVYEDFAFRTYEEGYWLLRAWVELVWDGPGPAEWVEALEGAYDWEGLPAMGLEDQK